jgi:hypothetical protein
MFKNLLYHKFLNKDVLEIKISCQVDGIFKIRIERVFDI